MKRVPDHSATANTAHRMQRPNRKGTTMTVPVKGLPMKVLGALRSATAAAVIATGATTVGVVALDAALSQAHAQAVNRIEVRGNQRVDADTIRSYVTIEPGQPFTSFDTDESLRALFDTGLFADVAVEREGRVLVVTVEEYPIVSRVIFEGNNKVKDETLRANVQLGDRSVLTDEALASDRERVEGLLRRSGRGTANVETEIVELGNNRVNVVFRITEGGRTKIRRIDFVGNNAFGDRRLREVVSLNQSNFLSFLKRDDVFDPDKLRTDEERLRRFYFNRGYADFEILSADAELDPDRNEYVITFTVDEGQRYRFGAVEIDNTLAEIETETLARDLEIRTGEVYSAAEIEESLTQMTERIAERGFAFAQVTPRGERDQENGTVNVTFFVDQGPRVYIDRIIVRGNTRTRDYVIRREFDLAEGDAYNRVLVNRAKRRLEALGIFEGVNVTTEQGSAPDRLDLIVTVRDKPTGEISVGGGYSSQSGAIAELSFSERNFLGRGQYLKITGGYGEDVRKYELAFTEPYFLGRRLAAGFDASYTINQATAQRRYDSDVLLFRPRLTAPITDNLRATVFYKYQSEDIDVPDAFALPTSVTFDPTIAGLDNTDYVTSSAGLSLVYSDLDNIQDPREGIYARFDQEFAGIGGDAEWLRTTARVSGYYTANTEQDIVLFGTVGGGNIYGYSGNELRPPDQFFRGGEVVRGFEPAGIGPRNLESGSALGGTTFFNATAEVQFPMPVLPRSLGFRGALFADAATLFDSNVVNQNLLSAASQATFDDKTIRASIGASIIWDSPFGPLRADVAHPIVKEDYDRKQLFRFGVSTRF